MCVYIYIYIYIVEVFFPSIVNRLSRNRVACSRTKRRSFYFLSLFSLFFRVSGRAKGDRLNSHLDSKGLIDRTGGTGFGEGSRTSPLRCFSRGSLFFCPTFPAFFLLSFFMVVTTMIRRIYICGSMFFARYLSDDSFFLSFFPSRWKRKMQFLLVKISLVRQMIQ